MQDDDVSDSTQFELSPATVPPKFAVHCRGFESDDQARSIGESVGAYVRALSRHFELSELDGVTIAYDYAQALCELDRGYETSHHLTPSDGHAIGVAMTPSVLRDDTLKSHIVLNANFVTPIADQKQEGFELALHIIAHECAHVEITAKFNSAFPGILLRQRHSDMRIAFRQQVIFACWDEYAATNLSAGVGEDPTDGYEDTFLKHLTEAREVANSHIRHYRMHGNVDRVVAEVYGTYGNLLKFAAYHLGNLNGQGIVVADRMKTVEALDGHWFASYFVQLDEACQAIATGYGRWSDQEPFEAIGNIADNLVRLGGIHFRYPEPGQLYVDIPFTADTMPC